MKIGIIQLMEQIGIANAAKDLCKVQLMLKEGA